MHFLKPSCTRTKIAVNILAQVFRAEISNTAVIGRSVTSVPDIRIHGLGFKPPKHFEVTILRKKKITA